MLQKYGDVPIREEIKVGQKVWGVEKKNYKSGQLTEGIVARILTSAPIHPRGIKVMLENGVVARVQRITPPNSEAEKIDTKVNTVLVASATVDEFSLR